MISQALLDRPFPTFASIRRTLYQLGMESRNTSNTLFEDVDGTLYQIVNHGEFARIEQVERSKE